MLAAGTAITWPRAARAQQPTMPVIGILHQGSPESSASVFTSFRQGLGETGYVEGRNVAFEFRWAHSDISRLPELAADLVSRRVSVIVALASTAAGLAAKAATTTIPVVFSTGQNPVQFGLVASFNRPGGNVTGINSMNVELAGKRIGLLHELLPSAARFALLANTAASTEPMLADVRAATSAIGVQLEVFTASTFRDIEPAFASLAQKRPGALLVSPGGPFNERRAQVATLVARHGVPALYPTREWIEVGGLMSYGPVLAEEFRQAGIYVGRILKGAKPAELPVMQPTRFDLVINLQTARAFGIEVPATLLARADEVIE
jgi:putative ABC transport system substrate-binding protein